MNCKLCPNKSKKYFDCHPVIQTDLFSFNGDKVEDVADINKIESFIKISCEVK